MAKSTERTINEIKFRMRRSKRGATRWAPGSMSRPTRPSVGCASINPEVGAKVQRSVTGDRWNRLGSDYQSFDRNYQARCPTAPQFTGMGQKTANIDIRVEPQLVEKIDAWRGRQRVPPSRTAAIVYMIEQFLKHDRQN
jgi:hypothetical protein